MLTTLNLLSLHPVYSELKWTDLFSDAHGLTLNLAHSQLQEKSS